MRVVAQDVAVLAGPGLALVGVAHQVLGAGKLARHEAPLEPGRKPGAAPPAQTRLLDLGDDVLGRDLLGENLLQGRVASAFHVVGEAPVVAVQPLEDDCVRSVVQRGHYFSSLIQPSIFSGVMNDSMVLLFTSMTVASAQAPKHSPSLSVKRPSAVVSFQSMPRRFFRCPAASSAPDSAHGRLVQMHSLYFPGFLRSYMA